ncbi:hypothetical protein CP533_4834 [Ophiocordyceps camponoti-saundersi (nom. inval.)]|nr:hypothetical protein CP533_4834 [Ophiocordyceps camponoti-saundersi (nom. inval.)]
MTAPILLSFAGVSLCLAACIEYLAQRSNAHGGLALSPSFQEIPGAAMMAQKYVPIIVATLYSMVWSWVDQDVRRMQPWFELSKPQGARGRDSLFLSYPHDFVLFAARKAAKKKHWAVFTSSVMMMVILFVLTPLQPSVMGIRNLVHSEPINLKPTTPTRVSPSTMYSPSRMFDGGSRFAIPAYIIKRFRGSLPLFTTREYALIPFSVEQDDRSRRAGANITAKTTKLWTELNCWPPKFMFVDEKRVRGEGTVDRGAPVTIPAARFTPHQNDQRQPFLFSDDGKCGISAGSRLTHAEPFSLGYISEQAIFHVWSPLPGQATGIRCNTSLAALTSSRLLDQDNTANPVIEISARVCQRLYFQQHFMATISAASSKLYESSLRPVSERLLLNESSPLVGDFEEYLQSLSPYSGNAFDRTKKALGEAMDELHFPGIEFTSLLFRYLLMGTNLSVSDLIDPVQLVYRVDEVRKLLFAISVHYSEAVPDNLYSNDTATVTFPLSGIIVSRFFSALVEALLVLNAVGAIVLLRFCQRSPCCLEFNPSSISRICRLCPADHGLIQHFEKFDFADERILKSLLADQVFRLSCARGEPYLDILATDEEEDLRNDTWSDLSQHRVKDILEKYLPNFFATMLEAFWILINRHFCLLEPFRQLCAGKARPDRTIETTYSAIPPQLAVWRAVKAHHFVLAMLALTTCLANLLGISLGTLVNEKTAVFRYSQRFEPTGAPSFNNQSLLNFHNTRQGQVPVNDTFLLYAQTTSTTTPLPPWTSKDYFFLPHRFEKSVEAAQYTVTTRGFRAQANCTPLHRLSPPPGGQSSECRSSLALAAEEWKNISKTLENPSSGFDNCARELAIPSTLNETGACEFDFVLAWARAKTSCPSFMIARAVNSSQHLPRTTALHCRPLLYTARFNVTVDETGKVNSYQQIYDDEPSFDYPGFNVHRRLLLRYAVDFSNNTEWHGGPTGMNWITLLAALSVSRNGSRDSLDPSKAPPNAAELLPTIEDLYRRGFAIFLGQHPDLFDAARAGESIEGVRQITETRIFLDPTSLVISLVIMSINMVVAIVVYARPAVLVLPRMPVSIASVIAYVAPSRIVADSKETLRDETLSYGRYIGVDGKPHTGIELDPHVTLIEPEARDSTARGLLDSFSGLIRRRKLRP